VPIQSQSQHGATVPCPDQNDVSSGETPFQFFRPQYGQSTARERELVTRTENELNHSGLVRRHHCRTAASNQATLDALTSKSDEMMNRLLHFETSTRQTLVTIRQSGSITKGVNMNNLPDPPDNALEPFLVKKARDSTTKLRRPSAAETQVSLRQDLVEVSKHSSQL
jgi:hypothetical protein